MPTKKKKAQPKAAKKITHMHGYEYGHRAQARDSRVNKAAKKAIGKHA